MTTPTKVQNWKISRFKEYENNPRINDHAVEPLAKMIQKFGFRVPILAKSDGTLIDGHLRLKAARHLGLTTVPVLLADDMSDADIKAFRIAVNQAATLAEWDFVKLHVEIGELKEFDFDLDVLGFELPALETMLGGGAGLTTQPDASQSQRGLGSLTDRFMIAPFSVLNAREGWWQDRKRAWISIGIQSELGRGENALGFSETILSNGKNPARTFGQDLMRGEHVVGEAASKKKFAQTAGGGGGGWAAHNEKMAANRAKLIAQGRGLAMGTQDWVQKKIASGEIEGGPASGHSGTSIFDPVLCELAYRWFSPVGGTVLDPFAGGSVRGVVCAMLGRKYVGVDLRDEQIEANRVQWADIAARKDAPAGLAPEWHIGDSLKVIPGLSTEADFIFSCPPYGDLEVYSDRPDDISAMSDAAFLEAYRLIIAKAAERLKPDRFACFVVGDYRDERGLYRDFVSRTIAAFRDAGMRLYNEIILVTAAGSLPIRAGKQFASTRKVGKTHQNVLVFVKGDPRKATEACGTVDVSEDMFERYEEGAPGDAAGDQWGEQL